MAIEAIAGAALLHQWIDLPVWQIGLVLMLALTAVNLLSSRSYGEFEFWFSSIKVAAIVIFILIAGAYALGLTSPTRSDVLEPHRARRLRAVRLRVASWPA